MAQPVEPKVIVIYEDENGSKPFSIWLKGLKDTPARQRIINRVQRIEQGNYGDCTPVGEGVFELRMFFGPGYRVYFGEEGHHRVILLCGGDKSSQEQDIKTAKFYWKEYKENG